MVEEKESLKYNANKIEIVLLEKVLSECEGKSNIENDDSSKMLKSSVPLTSEEQEYHELIMQHFKMKKNACKGLICIEDLDNSSSSGSDSNSQVVK